MTDDQIGCGDCSFQGTPAQVKAHRCADDLKQRAEGDARLVPIVAKALRWLEPHMSKPHEQVIRDACREYAADLLVARVQAEQEKAKCDKCGREVPRQFVAIEIEDGHPIDDPAGFQWCIVCHAQRVKATLEARLASQEATIAKLHGENEQLRDQLVDMDLREWGKI